MKEYYHWHHIVPRHAGGTDEPENLVRVTTEEHAELHLALYLEHGRYEDWIAYHALSGQIGKDEVLWLARSAGKKGWSWKENPDSYEKLCAWVRSPKGRQIQRDAARGRMKPIYCHQTDKVYESTAAAARELNISRPHIIRYLRLGKWKVKGYTFCYKV